MEDGRQNPNLGVGAGSRRLTDLIQAIRCRLGGAWWWRPSGRGRRRRDAPLDPDLVAAGRLGSPLAPDTSHAVVRGAPFGKLVDLSLSVSSRTYVFGWRHADLRTGFRGVLLMSEWPQVTAGGRPRFLATYRTGLTCHFAIRIRAD